MMILVRCDIRDELRALVERGSDRPLYVPVAMAAMSSKSDVPGRLMLSWWWLLRFLSTLEAEIGSLPRSHHHAPFPLQSNPPPLPLFPTIGMQRKIDGRV